jgi:hypothetical protein
MLAVGWINYDYDYAGRSSWSKSIICTFTSPGSGGVCECAARSKVENRAIVATGIGSIAACNKCGSDGDGSGGADGAWCMESNKKGGEAPSRNARGVQKNGKNPP